MKIIILTVKKQMYSPLIIKELLRENEIGGVFISSLSGHKKTLLANIRQAIKTSGWLYLFLRTVDTLHSFFLISTNSQFQTIEKFCQKNNIPTYQLGNINSDKTIKRIIEIKPDIIISLFFNQILKQKIISLPKYGCLNIHRSPLPKYRGPNSAFWQLANNENITGTTIHYIDEGVDSGNIVAQIKYPLLRTDTHHLLCLKNASAANSVLPEILKKIINNKIRSFEQQNEQATVYSFPTRQAVRNFLRHKKRMF